jgi:hypothetical protein
LTPLSSPGLHPSLVGRPGLSFHHSAPLVRSALALLERALAAAEVELVLLSYRTLLR